MRSLGGTNGALRTWRGTIMNAVAPANARRVILPVSLLAIATLLNAQPTESISLPPPGCCGSRSTLQAGIQSDLRVVKLRDRAAGFCSIRGLFKCFLCRSRNLGFQLEMALRDPETSV